MRVLVTGGAGFIGSHLVERLVEAAHDVRVLDDLTAGSPANLTGVLGDIELVVGDVRSRTDVARALRGREAVVHLAALNSVPRSFESPDRFRRTNVEGTATVARLAGDLGVRRMVFASSSSVYGASVDGARREDSRTAPLSPYAESKLEGERRCASESARSGLETIALRYFNVYGPRQPVGGAHGAAVPRFIESGLLRRPITIFGDGRQVRDFTYVDDIVEANVLALTARLEAATAVNVGRGSPTPIMRLAEMAMKAAGCSVPVEYTAPRAADVPYSVADTAHARQLLGFVAAHTLAEGLRATVDHRSMALADEATAI